jgi:hypothetical protein
MREEEEEEEEEETLLNYTNRWKPQWIPLWMKLIHKRRSKAIKKKTSYENFVKDGGWLR